jgi:mannosyl-3-phosphoglycerate phosphatase
VQKGSRIVVLARLEGTPFDPYENGVDSAQAYVQPILRAGIPIVFFSTRTRAELEAIQQELGIHHPFVAEEGGALHVPQSYFGVPFARSIDVAGYETVPFGRPHDQVLAALITSARRLKAPITTMSELSVKDVAAVCRLTLLQARLAKLRDYSELFRVADATDPKALIQALRSTKLQCRTYGGFLHVSAEVDADGIVDTLLKSYRRAFDTRIFVGIGDPHGDLAILCRVEVPLTWGHGTRADHFHENVRLRVETLEARADALVDIVRRLTTTLEASRLAQP